MEAAINWTTVSAVVQAISAVFIAVLTFFLARFTLNYVKEMRTANRLQEQANAISSGMLAQSAQTAAPFLVAAPGGGTGSIGGAATHKVIVQNRGGGLAHDIAVETTWGAGHIDSLAAGDSAEVSVKKETGYGHKDRPEVTRFQFRDAQNAQWLQEPSQIPVQGV